MKIDRDILWIWAVMVFRPGNKRLWEISANFDNIEEFVLAMKKHKITQASEKEYQRADEISFENAEKVIEKCKEQNINIYSYESEGYPIQLKRIANPPAVLFCLGNLDFINDKCIIAVVGTRKPSEYSLKITEKLGRDIINRKILLASGFAEGIDRKVNEISIEYESFPIAVCATPLDFDYPKGSMEFKEKAAEHGVVVSEYYPGSERLPNAFVNRNRILVGISRAALFVEAGRDSHGLDNVNHAVYQGKNLFVVPPHDIFDKRYFGQRDLLRNECQPVFGAEDIVCSLSSERYDGFKLAESLGEFTIPSEDSGFFSNGELKKPGKRNYRKKSVPVSEKKSLDFSDLNEIQTEICRLLESKNMLADEISALTGIDISEILTELTELELNGRVKSLPGKLFGI